MVSQGGGSNNLQAVTENHPALNNLGFTPEQIVKMVSHRGGSKNLVSVTKGYEALSNVWTRDSIVDLVSQHGGSKRIYHKLKTLDAVNALVALWPAIDPDINSASVEESSYLHRRM